jgi:hypothetical protein
MNKKVNIDYLYLDVTVCTRCQGSDLNLEDAVETLKSKFPNHGFNLNKIHIDTIDLALKEKFVSSPTIRVDGKDLPIEFKENNCDSCGDFCGDSVDCRIWVHNGEEFESAPTDMLVDLVSNYVNEKINLNPIQSNYSVPENIIHFFSARLNKDKPKEEESDSCGCETETPKTEQENSCCAPSKSSAECC